MERPSYLLTAVVMETMPLCVDEGLNPRVPGFTVQVLSLCRSAAHSLIAARPKQSQRVVE